MNRIIPCRGDGIAAIVLFAWMVALTMITSARAQTYDIEDYFIISHGSWWSYVGFSDTGGPVSNDDNFDWIVEAAEQDLTGEPNHGVMARRLLTDADENTDDREMDVDFFSIDAAGTLWFHGFHKGSETDLMPVQTILFNEPLKLADAGMTPGVSTFSDQTTATVTFFDFLGNPTTRELGIATDTEFHDIRPTKGTPMGEFHDVMVFVVDVNLTNIPLIGTLDFRDNVFYLAEDIGMIAQNQTGDPDDAQNQALDEGEVEGVPITIPGPGIELVEVTPNAGAGTPATPQSPLAGAEGEDFPFSVTADNTGGDLVSTTWFLDGARQEVDVPVRVQDFSAAFTFETDAETISAQDGARPRDKRFEIKAVVENTGGDTADVIWQVDLEDADRSPPAPSISVSPAMPRTTDDLVASIDAQDPDPDGDDITGYRIDWATVTGRNGVTGDTLTADRTVKGQIWQVTVTPQTDPYGDGAVDSPNGTTTEATILNTDPVADPQQVETQENTALAVSLTGTDPDVADGIDDLMFALVDGPTAGQLLNFDADTGDVTYSPAPDTTGPDSFTFAVSDDGLVTLSAPATVDIDVRGTGLDGWRFMLEADDPRNSAVTLGLQAGASAGSGDPDDVPFVSNGGEFDVLLETPAGALLTDVRGLVDKPSWFLAVRPLAAVRSQVVLSWTAAAVPPESLLLLDEVDASLNPIGSGPRIDMAVTESLVFDSSVERTFRIRLIVRDTQEVHLQEGWNSVAIRLKPDQPGIADVFQGETLGRVYYWDGNRYRPVSTIVPLTGMWVYRERGRGPATLMVSGKPLRFDEKQLPLHSHWNYAGVADPVPYQSQPPLQHFPWIYDDDSYLQMLPDQLFERGKAYWIYVDNGPTELDTAAYR